jgi:hypothetical protein
MALYIKKTNNNIHATPSLPRFFNNIIGFSYITDEQTLNENGFFTVSNGVDLFYSGDTYSIEYENNEYSLVKVETIEAKENETLNDYTRRAREGLVLASKVSTTLLLIKDTEDTLTIEQSDICKIIISDLMIGWWKSASGQLNKLLSISPGQDQIDALVTEILSEIEEEY